MVREKKISIYPVWEEEQKSAQTNNNTPNVFWCGVYSSNSTDCCYNHWLGLPEKNGILHPIYEYEQDIIKYLDTNKHVWILKARGLGITELFLRWIEWYCFTHPQSKPSQVVILTGVNLELAKDLILRIKHHLKDFSHDMYETHIGNYTIRAYPANHVHAYRGQENVVIIFGDEAAFFTMINDYECRSVVEGYMGKSNPFIIWNSTPHLPEKFFYHIYQENPSIYKKFYLPYTVGLEKDKLTGMCIYDQNEIEHAKLTPSFEREYNMQWGFGYGDVYDLHSIDMCVKEYPLLPVSDAYTEIDIDPAFGSSKFAVLVWQKINGRMRILVAEQYERPSISTMNSIIRERIKTFNCQSLGCDANNPEFIEEFHNEINTIARNFRTGGLEMLSISAIMVSSEEVEIHPKFEELIRQLRSAKRDSKNGDIDKKILLFDLGDAFRMGCYDFKKGAGYSRSTREPTIPNEQQVIVTPIVLEKPTSKHEFVIEEDED